VAAHNAPFDVGFLQAEFAAAGLDLPTMYVVDTRVCSKLLWPSEPASLDPMMDRLGVDRGNRDERHDALEDCRLLARCLPGLVAEIARRI
jgi:DNA polymerase III epsilon subunit-like protein